MSKQDYNLHIAKEIWSILRAAPEIIMSWGLNPNTVKVVDCGIQFHVQGFNHTGIVEVKLNEGVDLYEVYLYDDSGNVKESHIGIFVNELISTIDKAVEYTGSDYKEKVDALYPNLREVKVVVVV